MFKDDGVIARYHLGDRKASLIGSNYKVVHIPSYHESISRQHVAVVFHRGLKCFFLIDMASFSGTFIDGEKIEKYLPTKSCSIFVCFYF